MTGVVMRTKLFVVFRGNCDHCDHRQKISVLNCDTSPTENKKALYIKAFRR